MASPAMTMAVTPSLVALGISSAFSSWRMKVTTTPPFEQRFL